MTSTANRRPKSRRNWTEAELELLRTRYDGKNKTEICRELGRSKDSVTCALAKLGISYKQTHHQDYLRWQDGERNIVFDHIGELPIEDLLKKVNHWRRRQRLQVRSLTSLKSFVRKQGLGYSIDSADHFSLRDIARGLNCSLKKVQSWTSQYHLEFKPMKNGHYVSRWALKQFWTDNPATLQGLHPDMPWLVDILTSAKAPRVRSRGELVELMPPVSQGGTA